METMTYPRIMIAAPSSGSGKTMVTCGLLRVLKKRGIPLSVFKCGPDYIDPMFHKKVSGVPSRNLDTFFTCEKKTVELFCTNASQLSVFEGVMGYYDGVGGNTVQAGSYDLSRVTKTPVIFVLDTKGMSLSLVAILKGFLEYKKDCRIQGVIFNRMSPMLYPRMKKVVEEELPIQVLGYLPYLPKCTIESRHLGLVTPSEQKDLNVKLEILAQEMEKTLDIDKIIALAKDAEPLECSVDTTMPEQPSCRIAVAQDEAFCFYYEDNLDLLKKLGCELVSFSPLRDKKLPHNIQGLLLGGGYPELYAKELSENATMCYEIQQSIQKGLPCIAECGGFLYLHEQLEDTQENAYPMVGVIAGKAFPEKRRKRFGYITLTAQKDTLLCKKGEHIPAHEFHYWESEQNGEAFLAEKPIGTQSWKCIYAENHLFAGFPHIHFYGNLEFAENFVKACEKYKGEKQ